MNKLDHVAFIMDGNGRWGKKRNRSRNFGHLQGVKTVKKIVEISLKMQIPIITFYVFSTENWKRPRSEINFLFNLIKTYFTNEIKNVIKNNIKINIIGNSENLPIPVNKILKDTILKTKKNKKLIVNLAINYGSRDEIVKSTNKILKQKKKISINSVN
ncbi:polyprenyl diphosphate synthase, partial [Pelagibacteraceae bacterium]|nr:polyprenyl diphosphate synthase [Pelagibacteraceae bacterium]